ncbi:hypothetical protein G6011_02262 [Alternaria panax]|uniref:Heterokaryon incompatibility domain-containing protein n=1 Tax=Alternaria panax TaxID=48097 RepID=A0AAD4I9B7_9PLEO|nr:hypothetical protein G6011_02262 [Alternaria panax]
MKNDLNKTLAKFSMATSPLSESKKKEQDHDPLHDQWVPSREIPITKPKDNNGETPYIAVSWKLIELKHEVLYDDPKQPVFDYKIKRPGANSHKSDFPGPYMDRECIYQRPGDERMWPDDKEHGVQIMDEVYGDSDYLVGLLTMELAHQLEIGLLLELLQGHLYINPENKDTPKLRSEVDVTAVQILVLRILSDPRWSRGWIFQEDHLASNRMTLLMPRPQDIRIDCDYDIGDIIGELQINLKDLRQNVTMFYLACIEERQRWPNTEIIGKVKQYNTCNKIYMPPEDEYPLRPRSDSVDGGTGGSEITRQTSESSYV